MARPHQQQIEILGFGPSPLSDLLRLVEPPFLLPGEAHRQLKFIDGFVRQLGCQAMLIENHYIDRHYMEEHSVFYSRNLYPYVNFCRRIHFFSGSPEKLKAGLQELRRSARETAEADHRVACQEFSRECYLGFCVIKPLPGSPVGRTVLRPGPTSPTRRFPCARSYTVHLGGLELAVRGLAFQQQDVGVSACATTAIWSALQKFQDFEDVASATPAQITNLASQYTLPFGRAMPSEGLSLDQMCQAIRALGVAPNLFQAVDFETARGYLYSAISSELPAILILRHESEDLYHAVVAVGFEVNETHEVSMIAGRFADDRAGDLTSLYVHDDRIGPYVPARIRRSRRLLALDLDGEPWRLSHVLIPMHTKIRLSFSGLRHVASRLVQVTQAYRETVLGHAPAKIDPVLFDLWITPSYSYLKNLLTTELHVDLGRIEALWKMIPLPRYVGIVRLEVSSADPIHFIVDCTSTERNIHSLAALALRNERPETSLLVQFLAQRYDCEPLA